MRAKGAFCNLLQEPFNHCLRCFSLVRGPTEAENWTWTFPSQHGIWANIWETANGISWVAWYLDWAYNVPNKAIVLGYTVERTEKPYDCCRGGYITLKFTLYLRRRTLYYGFNKIVPSLLIALTAVLSFALPAESIEKITLGEYEQNRQRRRRTFTHLHFRDDHILIDVPISGHAGNCHASNIGQLAVFGHILLVHHDFGDNIGCVQYYDAESTLSHAIQVHHATYGVVAPA